MMSFSCPQPTMEEGRSYDQNRDVLTSLKRIENQRLRELIAAVAIDFLY
jgi:hypothetical protein